MAAIGRISSLACSACLMKAGLSARVAGREYHSEAADLVLQHDALADQLLARDDQRAMACAGKDFTWVGLKNPVQARWAGYGIVAVRLWVASDFSAWYACRLSMQTTGRMFT